MTRKEEVTEKLRDLKITKGIITRVYVNQKRNYYGTPLSCQVVQEVDANQEGWKVYKRQFCDAVSVQDVIIYMLEEFLRDFPTDGGEEEIVFDSSVAHYENPWIRDEGD